MSYVHIICLECDKEIAKTLGSVFTLQSVSATVVSLTQKMKLHKALDHRDRPEPTFSFMLSEDA